MPPLGWRKPPGSTGYARRAVTKRKSKDPRSAGPHMLPGRRVAFGNINLDVATAGSDSEAEPPEDDPPDEEDAQSEEENADNPEGPPSKRLRLRKGAPAQAQEDDEISAPESDYDGMPALLDHLSDGEGGDGGAQSQRNTAAARARRAPHARVDDDDDPLEDIPTPCRAVPVQASPVHQDLHVLELSVTLSKSKGHINLAWLTLVHDWMKLRCEAGAVAQERGGKAQHLHLQIMLRMRIATMDLDALKLELKTLVGWQRGDGSGCYCSVKEFGIGQARLCISHPYIATVTSQSPCQSHYVCMSIPQTWIMMLGYLHKDQSQPHFKVRMLNINPADVIRGVAEWQTAKLSYEDDKIMITKPNIFHRLSTWRLNADPESDHPFLEDMTNMLNSKKYMISTAFITQSGALRLSAAEAMWKLVKGNSMTITDTQELLFQKPFTPYRPGAAVPGQRFFDTYGEGTTFDETDAPITATEGFMATDNPQGAAPPVTADCLSPFVRRQLDAHAARMRRDPFSTPTTASAVREAPNSSDSHAAQAIRPDSPRSVDSGEHDSDADFLDDAVNDASDPDDLYTCQPVRSGNGKDTVM